MPVEKKLAPASESISPDVHRVLAERAGAVVNGDKKAIEAADKKLADLGVTV